MPNESASSNPAEGHYCGGQGLRCDWCADHEAEWRFVLRKPRIGVSPDRCSNVYGCGIHWKQAASYQEAQR